jgi:hypothetical protein
MKTLLRMAIFISLILPYGKILADDATTYQVGDLYYQIDAEGQYVDGSPSCVKVVRDASNPYAGDVTIPSSVVIEDKTYRVWKIAAYAFNNSSTETLEDGSSRTIYASELTSVVIPSSVTQIHSSSFKDCNKLTRVTIGYVADGETGYDDDVYIYQNVFEGCTALTTIDFGKYVRYIDSYAFHNCSALLSVTFTDRLETVNSYAFQGCTAMTSASFGLTESGKGANKLSLNWYSFNGCTSLATINFANNITSLGNGVFEGCTSITDAILPNSLTTLSDRAFYGCTALTTVVIPDSITSLPDSCFKECPNITTLTLPDSLSLIPQNAFQGLEHLETLTIGDSDTFTGTLMSIEAQAFSGCTALKTINLGTCVGSIGDNAFAGSAIANITIPNAVSYIGSKAFLGCSELKEIDIPNSVKKIGASCFEGCTALTNVILGHDNEAFDTTSLMQIDDNAFQGCTNIVTLSISKCVGVINNGGFKSCTGITSLTISKNISSIGEAAFFNCTSIKDITIGSNISDDELLNHEGTKIQNGAFDGCTALESVYLYPGVNYIGKTAFNNCTNLKKVEIPAATTYIGHSAFYGCKSITEVIFGYDSTKDYAQTTIDDSAFSGCSAMTSVTFHPNVIKIGDRAFFECTSLEKVTIPTATVSIGEQAFYGNTAMTELIIGDEKFDDESYTNIMDQAFSHCDNLKQATLYLNVRTIGNSAFNSNEKLQTLTMAYEKETTNDYGYTYKYFKSGVHSIGNDAFRDCSELTNFEFGNVLESIGNYAFCACSSLQAIQTPVSTTVIGEFAFNSCTTLQTVVLGDTYQPHQGATKAVVMDQAFSYCSALQFLYIGCDVGQLKWKVFNACISLNKGGMVWGPETPPTIYYRTFDEEHYMWKYAGSNADLGKPDNETTNSGNTSTTDTTNTGNGSTSDNSNSDAIYAEEVSDTDIPFSSDPSAYADVPDKREGDGLEKNTKLYSSTNVDIHVKAEYFDTYYKHEIWTLFLNTVDMTYTSIEEVAEDTDKYFFYTNGDTMILDIPEGETAFVYDIYGHCLYQGGATMMDMPHGIYIVRVNNKSAKIKL